MSRQQLPTDTVGAMAGFKLGLGAWVGEQVQELTTIDAPISAICREHGVSLVKFLHSLFFSLLLSSLAFIYFPVPTFLPFK